MNATSWSWWILLSCACWVFIRRYRTVWYDVCLVLACAVIFPSCPAHCLCHNSGWRWHFFFVVKASRDYMMSKHHAINLSLDRRRSCWRTSKWEMLPCHPERATGSETESKPVIQILFLWRVRASQAYLFLKGNIPGSDVSLTYLIAQHWWQIPLELIQLQTLEGPETCAIARRVGGWWRWG